jgi:hypothetical protein
MMRVRDGVYDAEESLACARRNEGFRAIGGCHSAFESFPRACVRFAVPAKLLADQETDFDESAHDRRRCTGKGVCPHKFIQRDAGAYPRQLHGPNVVKRHASKKTVNPQWQPFKFLRRDLWHRPLRCPQLCEGVLRTPFSLTQDASQECLCASRACDANNYRPHIGLRKQIERQETTAFPLRHDQVRCQLNRFTVTRKAKGISVLKVLSLND